MASKTDYANWCHMLIQGKDFVIDEILEALLEDAFINIEETWVYDNEEYRNE